MKLPKVAEVALPLPLDKTFDYRIPKKFASQLTLGQRVVVPFGKSKKIGYLVGLHEKSKYPKLKKIINLYTPELSLTEELLALGYWLASNYLCSLGEVLATILSPYLKMVKFPQQHLTKLPEVTFSPLSPTKSQQRVINIIKKHITLGKKKVFLLHGVSASGKTEVYFQVIDFCLKKNKEIIFLVPEIALTPQFVELFQKRFGKVGLWHSRLSKGEKYRYFLAAKNGELKIMLGARSAIFTPFKNLGLIIIDEEQEFTYKQDKKPFYHTREVALKRAELNNAVVILGSATPSLESYYASKNNKFRLLELPERVEERKLPVVKIVDMRKEMRGNHLKKGYRSIISQELEKMLAECLEKKEQAILFLNRRGYSTFLLCRRCGYVVKCPHCHLSLVYHRGENILSCHYCRYKEEIPISCPSCRSLHLSFSGTGTEKVENEIRRLFPRAHLRRVDLDTTKRKNVYHEIYHAFKSGEIDILIGTQMIAKGFDFPKVSVVGIINADTALHLPDFRAAERTFQLITQVAGRAGRAEIPGKVVLQTYCPEHYALLAAAGHNYAQLYAEEIKLRKELGYPPFVSLVRILIRGEKEEKVRTLAAKIAEEIRIKKQILKTKNIKIFGPTPAAYPRIAGKYRWQILLKSRERDNLNRILNPLKDSYHSNIVQISFDVDPIDML